MATVTPRRMLIFKILKKLPDLNVSQLQKVATTINDGQEIYNMDKLSEPELNDFIIEYIRSDELKAMEDEGMTQLLILHDLLHELSPVPDTGAAEVGDVAQQLMEDATTHQYEHSPSASKDENIHTHLSTMDRDTHEPTRNVHLVRMSSSSTDPVVRLTDVTALLPQRECKRHGGQISDTGSDISYNDLCKQIDTSLQEGFCESEVMRAVLKITKPGTFREMLTSKDDLTVEGLKRFFRSHIKDKNVTELFQELNNAKQQDRESPQQFLYRVMGLKQRVLSQQPGVDFSYGKTLLQGTFLHTLYQGLNYRNSHVRRDLKPFLSNM